VRTPVPLGSIRLVATDLDGTLLTDAGTIAEPTLAALDRARRAGLEVAFLTARPPADADALLGGYGLTGFLVAANGAVVRDRRGGLLRRLELCADEAQALVKSLRAAFAAVALGAVSPRRVVLDPGFPAELAARWKAQTSTTVERLLAREPVLKLLAAFPATSAAEACGPARALCGDRFQVTYSSHRFLEITAPDATKGAALAVVARAAGLPLTAVACVGDMPNDLQMMRAGGLAVAVANADPAVRQAADLVVSGNEEGGVAELLESILRARGRSAPPAGPGGAGQDMTVL
jgi:Cof subfamily protein (haloacid dehalogenase superfamily)